ncbi:hypothetical protein STRIP9103_04170 [Streptomyces ipomoeae 91-03]|uniref:Uncharacterized protein n=1 Tax=Streptomyces ipomoeae 91-03 TaxID=698759 RepID=L1KJT9_9ACTN|nr:hypothetical protein STRIP9103_04170 [Streptomyces ipomoeae 91-03]
MHSTVNKHPNATQWRAGDFTHRAHRAAFGPIRHRSRKGAP